MKKTVLFLGAGMSASFGYPVTKDILPLIINKIKGETLFNEVTRNREVSSIYRALLKQLFVSLSPGLEIVFRKDSNVKNYRNSLPLVTELLSQLEHLISTNHSIVDWNFDMPGKLLKPPSKMNDRWELANLKILFDWALISVVKPKKDRKPSEKISQFINWINRENRSKNHFVSIISTNYDVEFEWELLDYGQVWDADKEIDFGFSWRDAREDKGVVYLRPNKPIYRIFKLHGSVDWIKCDRCGFIYVNPTADEQYKISYSNKKNEWNSCHCGFWPLKPVLITPSFVRKVDDSNLREIWRSAFEELRTANEWIIVGYSIPPEDFDIRSMFLRAMISNPKDISVKVIQKSRASELRYDMFFGKGNYKFIDGGFEDYVEALISPRRSRKAKVGVIKAKKI